MAEYKLGEIETIFADIIWDNEPVSSRRLTELAEERLDWKRTTTYTILKRLENAGMLTVRSVEHGGRLRKYYHITKAGLGRLEDFKDEWSELMSIYQFVIKGDIKK